jgi:hypothetical protein
MWPLLLVVAAGAVFWTLRSYDRTVPRPPGNLRRLLGALRSVVFLLLVVAIAGPVISLLLKDQVPAGLLVVIEDSGSMAIADCEDPHQGRGGEPVTRWECALARASVLDSIFASHDPPVEVVFLRGNGIDPVQEFRLDDPVIPPPAGHGTDLEALLLQARERLAGRPLQSVVLISDGQETRGLETGRGVGRAQDAKSRQGELSGSGGISLQVLGVGDPQGSADRVIKDLRYPDTAYEGDEIQVDFSVDHRFAEGSLGSTLQVRLLGDEGVVASQEVEVTGRVVPVSMTFDPGKNGLQVYRLEVSALDNERFLDNNQASLAVDVRKERARLLLLAGSVGWDSRFLAQAASSEERLKLEVVFLSDRGPVFADSLVAWVPPTSAAGWAAWDGVIISDWGGYLTGTDWEPLREAVTGGLGLLVVPGSGTGGPGGISPPPAALGTLLPVQVTGWRWNNGPLFVAVPAARSGHPVLEGMAGPEVLLSGAHLDKLPPLRGMVAAEIRPGATVLLTGRRRESPAGEAGSPLLVTDGLGAGRVSWFGGRNLWELSFWDPSGKRLLRNLLVWTAAGEDNSGLVFTGRQTFFQEGERISLAAQWRDMRGHPVVDQKLSLQLRQQGADADTGRVRTFALSRTDRSSGFAEVALPPLPPGRYTVQLVGQGDPPVMGRVESLVVAGHSIESTQVRMDRRRLVQLATRAEGVFLDGGEPESDGSLVEKLAGLDWSGLEMSRRNRIDFWSGWPFLILMAALLGVEWFLRRRNGLL